MPELPEVETIRRGLAEKLVGHQITAVTVRQPKLLIGDSKALIGQKVVEMGRRAKILIWKLADCYLLTHLKMTGQLIFQPDRGQLVIGGHPDKAYGENLPHQHSHVIITFDNGILFFNDLRKFGWMKIVETLSELKGEISHLGPEYTWPEFTLKYFQAGLAKRRITIKQALLDQTFIAGIGNIYADESLFCAQINPKRKSNELTDIEAKKLFASIPKILNLALRHGGSSSRDYRQADGSLGTYLQVALVYKLEGQPCKVCGQPIERSKIAGRSTHFCPKCQS